MAKPAFLHRDPIVNQEFIRLYSIISGLFNAIPVGSIIVFPIPQSAASATENNIPLGYLPCNGNEYPVSKYPELYSVVGTAFGLPSISGNFKVPSITALGTYLVYAIKAK